MSNSNSKPVQKVSRDEAIELLKGHRENGQGRMFSVSFSKRTDGQRRDMTARFQVTSHLKGGSQDYEPSNVALMTVFDMQAKGYRSINLLGLIAVTINGQRYEVK